MSRSEQLTTKLREAVGQINEPPNMVSSFAEKSGKSESEVEELWNEAKSKTKEQYPDIDEDSDRFYQITVAILKNMLGIK